ncbi:unnamed protein product [Phytomonas sp. EM1]|nr:unnamed protein product [Phytomonas sp. EM1]|eukprot:CCW59914.1 unnamed protein product [Phytomonas sp. isolate EM1]
MSAFSWWHGLRNSRFKDVPFVCLGLFIGWNSDFGCTVNGRSMLPTLEPGDFLLFIPYSLLAFKKLFGKQLVNEGDVVVLKISDHLSVCKRVIRTTASAQEVADWNARSFIDAETYLAENIDRRISQEKREWDDSLNKTFRSREWDSCIDRVSNPLQWIWVEGDNKDTSMDSRACGAVPVECLRGRGIGVIWPHLKLLKRQTV